jgi:aryl-alcohol dehydrogenase-like predicted oxidoreductase
MTEQADRVVQELMKIGRAREKSPAQVALAWVLSHPGITSVIIGPSLPEHVDENFGGVGWMLSEEERSTLDSVSQQK